MPTPGKVKCETLKHIRKAMAEANGIPYNPPECHHEGECLGTCPQCEAELWQLDRAIRKKHGSWSQAKGVAISRGAIAAASLVISSTLLSSCKALFPVNGSIERSPATYSVQETEKSK